MLGTARSPSRTHADHQGPPGLRSPESHQVSGGEQPLQGLQYGLFLRREYPEISTFSFRPLRFCVVLCAGFSEGDCGFSLLPVLLGPIAVRTAKDLALLFFSPFKIVLVTNFKATNWLPWRYTTVLAFLDLRSVNKYQLSDECLRHPRKSIVYDE